MMEAAEEVLTLVCPECGSDMVGNHNNRIQVFSCSNYPKCKKTLTGK